MSTVIERVRATLRHNYETWTTFRSDDVRALLELADATIEWIEWDSDYGKRRWQAALRAVTEANDES